ncbi:hypothetical protein CEXT_280791 [Caerostris extrusa]|uniref:Uncharacterized protein n=1 Tax=Caerostris extrusa TaxID=172846 RepID=A0AAV4PG37_CAEEX|nr:hypothetical protein CEXT_280791 [Caerostris extrusa]
MPPELFHHGSVPPQKLLTTHESAHLFESLDRNIVLKSPPRVFPWKSDEIVSGMGDILLCYSSCVIRRHLLSLPAINAMALPTQEDPA